MKFHKDISSNVFVHNQNLPSYDFFKIENHRNFSISQKKKHSLTPFRKKIWIDNEIS